MSCHLGGLASGALACPVSHVLVDGSPDVSGRHHVLRSSDASVVEPLRDGREGAGRRVSVSRHLGGLTVGAGAGPQSDVFVDFLPDEARRHQVLQGSDARVREVAELTEGLVAMSLWQVRTDSGRGDVIAERDLGA